MSEQTSDFQAGARGRLTPARLRELLAARGAVGVKLGQFLAVRPDLIPQEYADELLALTDQVAPAPWSVTRRILTEDLRLLPEDAFAWINTAPVASGSLASVHVVRGHDGAELAVKVQREGVGEEIRRELARARWLARVLDAAGVVKVISTREVVEEFDRWLAQELDFEAELRSQARMWVLNDDDARAVIPAPVAELSGPRVVTSELVPGFPFSELLRMVRAGEHERIADMGFDTTRLAENLLTTVLRQVFVDRVFHADPHPGNLLALPDDVVCFVDFGLVDELDPTVHRGLDEYIGAMYAQDVERMFRGARQLFVPTAGTDMDSFKREFVAATQDWQQSRTRGRRAPGERTPLAGYLIAVLAAARDHHLRVPPRILSIYRTLLTAETVAGQIGAEADLDSVGRRFFARLRVQRALMALGVDNAVSWGAGTLSLLEDAPGALHRVLVDLAEERFVLPVKMTEATDARRRATDRARLVSASLLVVAASVLTLAAALEWGGAAAIAPFVVVVLLAAYALAVSRRLR